MAPNRLFVAGLGPRSTTLQVDAPDWFAPGTAVVIGSLLLSILLLTLGYSLLRARRRRRRDAVRENLRSGLLERLYASDDPAWTEWVDSLSTRERSVLETLLEKYLRELAGADARRLTGLGTALGIGERSRRRLESGGRQTRLNALTWLALLQDAPDVSTLEERCTGTPRERAAATRALYVSEHDDIGAVGVDLLLGGSPGPFSVFGIDTLYRVAEVDPGPLFDRAAADYGDWGPALQAQILLVCRNLNTVLGDADLSWVLDLTASSAEQTRVEAVRTLGAFGWRTSLRERVDIDALTSDPSSVVRGSVYRMLGEWGDEKAAAATLEAAAAESDARARVAAASALVGHSDVGSPPASLTDAWSWATEHAVFDRLARDVSVSRESIEVGDA
jgi:hypothetical protein